MALLVEDELDEVTSPEIPEVENENNNGGDDLEHPTEEPDDETVKLLQECDEHAKSFRAVVDEIDTIKPTIIRLKSKFGVKKGYAGKRLVVDGVNAMLWSEYCQITFNITPNRMNQLVNDSDKETKTVIKSPHQPSMKDKHIADLKQENGKLENKIKNLHVQMDSARAAFVRKLKEKDESAAEQTQEPGPKDNVVEMQTTPALDAKDPYAYFEQFKDEPQTMASELATMLVGFDCDDTTLLDALKKELRKQRKELAQAKSAKAGN